MRLVSRSMLIIFVLILLIPGVSLAQSDPIIETRYIGNITFDQLSAGANGSGTLIYYLPDAPSERPSLVVRFTKVANANIALAEVFDAPKDKTYVPISIQSNQVVLDASLKPAVVMQAPDGWWVRNGRVNYNLDILINGPVYAMWGAGADPKYGADGWRQYIEPGEPAVDIKVRDPQGENMPAWELRTLIPPFEGYGFYRTNYAERTCKTPLLAEPSPTPLWPFVALKGVFEQPVHKLQPPIVVDWEHGRITTFSELVTVRNQSCSYSLYSLDPIKLGELNHPNFETPFAFYDLSGERNGLPNLILRTQRFPAYDQWSGSLDYDKQQGKPVDRDIEQIRYSWRLAPGDRTWDYKVEVLGFHPYTFQTPIAGGLATIDAPPYDQFPGWVMQQNWPTVTFIDTGGASYRSSEGIYEWGPLAAGVDYLLGWVAQPDTAPFQDINDGFRGEYRFERDMPVSLYVSSIDHKVHLLGAEGGTLRISNALVLREGRLGSENYINVWTRERQVARAGSDNYAVEEQLYALPDFLLYGSEGQVELRQVEYQPALMTLQPPTDQASWQAFREKIAPYDTDARNPADFRSWFEAFPGSTLAFSNAEFSDVQITRRGFQFVVTLLEDFRASTNDLVNTAGLSPGSYVVTYDGKLAITPLASPQINVAITSAEYTTLQQSHINVQVETSGPSGIRDATLELIATSPTGAANEVISQTLNLDAGTPQELSFNWAPTAAGNWQVTPRIRQANGEILTLDAMHVTVQPTPTIAFQALEEASIWPRAILPATGMMVLFVSLAALLVWRTWRI